jgi:hypothetical protein
MDDYEFKTQSRLNPLTREDFLSYPEGYFFGVNPEDMLIKSIENSKKHYDMIEKSMGVKMI